LYALLSFVCVPLLYERERQKRRREREREKEREYKILKETAREDEREGGRVDRECKRREDGGGVRECARQRDKG